MLIVRRKPETVPSSLASWVIESTLGQSAFKRPFEAKLRSRIKKFE